MCPASRLTAIEDRHFLLNLKSENWDMCAGHLAHNLRTKSSAPRATIITPSQTSGTLLNQILAAKHTSSRHEPLYLQILMTGSETFCRGEVQEKRHQLDRTSPFP